MWVQAALSYSKRHPKKFKQKLAHSAVLDERFGEYKKQDIHTKRIEVVTIDKHAGLSTFRG